MTNPPDQRTLLVTGASSGIGHAIALRLIEQGHVVLAVGRNFSKTASHENFVPVSLELNQLEKLPDRLSELIKQYPELDGLVCCAGKGQFGSLEEFSYRQIRELVDINFTSQVYVIRALLPLLKRKRRGDIILMGSEAALSGGRRGAVYSASKFALRGLAQSLREECARSHIRVTLVNPGMVDTPFFDDLDFRPGEARENYLLPEDIAEAVLMALNLREGSVLDEINLSPLKKVIRFEKSKT